MDKTNGRGRMRDKVGDRKRRQTKNGRVSALGGMKGRGGGAPSTYARGG